MDVPLSHRHHYVPEWYQRRFLADGQTAFRILDLKPTEYRDGKGNLFNRSKSIFDKGPSSFFFEKDLYSTRAFGSPNDDIEKYLFGAIDREGRKAIDAFLEEDWDAIHETDWSLYEFLDALRLRTPKGLEFLRTLTHAKNHNELFVKMQNFRRMHCLMWAEGAREIVSVKDCNVKFIFTDHPVTFFNQHVFPADPKLPK